MLTLAAGLLLAAGILGAAPEIASASPPASLTCHEILSFHVTGIYYNARGADRDHLHYEYVKITNTSSSPRSLYGFHLHEQLHGHVYTFTGHTAIPAGGSKYIQSDLLNWTGPAGPIWDNDGDEAILYNTSRQETGALKYQDPNRQGNYAGPCR